MTGIEGRKILVVEDDRDIARLIELHLKDLGYRVDLCEEGRSGLQRALSGEYAMLILDLMLPGMDGHDICRKVREQDKTVPILFLSLRSELVDKIVGLELGADDYMTKPFSIQELKARVKALLRRVENTVPAIEETSATPMVFGPLVINKIKRRVSLSGNDLDLTPKQFDLLCFLAETPGRPYSRQELLECVWGYESTGYEHTVDTHINRLRAKVEPDPATPKYILTVWGVGYRFVEVSEL